MQDVFLAKDATDTLENTRLWAVSLVVAPGIWVDQEYLRAKCSDYLRVIVTRLLRVTSKLALFFKSGCLAM